MSTKETPEGGATPLVFTFTECTIGSEAEGGALIERVLRRACYLISDQKVLHQTRHLCQRPGVNKKYLTLRVIHKIPVTQPRVL